MTVFFSSSALIGVLLLVVFTRVSAQEEVNTISVGDIAVIGMNKGDPDSFALVALETIPRRNMVRVTDKGWSTSGFRAVEGTLLFNVTEDIPAGTVWSYETDNTTTNTNVYGSWIVDQQFKLSLNGDQILVYTGEAANPNFIYGASNGWTTEEFDDSSSSQLPPQLVDENAFVNLGDNVNAKYDESSPHDGTQSELLVDINKVSKWNISNVTRFDVHSFQSFHVINEESIDMISESGIIAVILVSLLIVVGAVLNEVAACKKEKSRKELLYKAEDENESKL